MDVEIKGLDSLLLKLDKLSNGASIVQGLNKAVARVERTAKQLVPVDDGFLKASITHDVDVSALSGTVGTPLSYAPYVEFGTGIYADSGTGKKEAWTYQDEEGKWHTTLGQQPQPFLYPALIENEKKIINDIRSAVRKDLKGGTKA